jgi:hypothetical protein
VIELSIQCTDKEVPFAGGYWTAWRGASSHGVPFVALAPVLADQDFDAVPGTRATIRAEDSVLDIGGPAGEVLVRMWSVVAWSDTTTPAPTPTHFLTGTIVIRDEDAPRWPELEQVLVPRSKLYANPLEQLIAEVVLGELLGACQELEDGGPRG